ncbi:MAG: MFS transporter, partial [Clostridiaceae bacterium]|nr:MFS transporter [Clostridiaceae bacterium]
MSKHNSYKTNDKQDKSADRQQIKVPVYLTAALFLIMGIYAISITMIGPIMPSVIEDYQIRLSQGGLMTTAQSIGGMLAVLFVGIMAGRFKKTKLIIISFLVFGASLLLVSLSDIYAVLLVVFFVFGAGSRMADTLLNAYVSDLYNKKRGYYLNLLHMYFGIGALIGPIYVR